MLHSTSVNSMFGRISGRYDLANRVLSGGLDLRWRARLVEAVRRSGAREILDLATGSGDVALALGRSLPAGADVLGVDFCLPMLDHARRKQAAAGACCAGVSFASGDALALDLPDGRFDAVTIAFGLRNLSDRARGLGEIRRVLRPGGRLFVLEFSQPSRWFQPFYSVYLSILPRLGGLISGDGSAYAYLTDTIERFPNRYSLSREILASGFLTVTASPLMFGAVALHEAAR
jgi:demethylmenaquinone methyltransferase / 2-methoxy-6-polyprenyl-1,4-benzoquinol methylase